MPTSAQPFSMRHGYAGRSTEITVREDAPCNLRYFVLDSARELGWAPSSLRDVLCRVLHEVPDSNNWSEYPNIWDEVQGLIDRCEWFKIYDIIEALHARFVKNDRENRQQDAPRFADAINGFFLEKGIGWQLLSGEIVTRGSEAFETAVKIAVAELCQESRPTAATHIHEALEALSRRPEPDLSGAVYHAMGSLECVARDVSGDAKATLGEILKRQPELLPKPLDTALEKIWGYASDEARHVSEGREPDREKTELIVGLSAAIATYLTRKNPQKR